MSRTTGRMQDSHNTLIANKLSESVAKFGNFMQGEIKNRLRVLATVQVRLFCLFVVYLKT